MQTIWVVENNSSARSIALELMGDFAVRRIASIASLLRLRQINRKASPDIVIIAAHCEDPNLLQSVRTAFGSSDIYIVNSMELPAVSFKYLKIIESPFCPIAFVRQVRSAQAGAQAFSAGVFSYGDIELDVVALKITGRSTGEFVSLTRKEALVLKKFFEKPGACIGREALLKDVWNGVRVTDRSIDAQICRLRKLVGDFGLSITSVYGQGYVLG